MRRRVAFGVLCISLLNGCAAPVEDLGPLAVAVGFNGNKARNQGRLEIAASCVYLRRTDGSHVVLIWPAGQVEWAAGQRTITYANHTGQVNVFGDGDQVVVGGSGGSLSQLTATVEWLAAPSVACDTIGYWWLGDVTRE